MDRHNRLLPSVAVCGMLLAFVATSPATELNNAEPLPAPSPSGPTVPAPSSPAAAPGGPKCCYCPCIEYRHHGRPICCCDCNAPAEIKTVLRVKDPRNCCTVEIPVCLPGCCTGEPCVSSHCGVLDRGIVRYEYDCGVRVTVIFRARGDILVSYLHA